MPANLTETTIRKTIREAPAFGSRRDLSDASCPGLRLRVTPSGSASWVLACRDRHGRMRRFPLGSYPSMGISEARTAARTTHYKVKHEGADPIADRRRDRAIGLAAKDGIGTLDGLLTAYGHQRGSSLKSWPEAQRQVRSVFKAFSSFPIGTLSAHDLQLEADKYPARHSAAVAVRSLRPILKWASKRGHVRREIADLQPPATVKRRDRVLSKDELGRLLPIMRRSDRPYAAALRFILLTLARREEVGRARWIDIDFDAKKWIIPETKNGQPHIVPLSRQALELLANLGGRAEGELVFCVKGGGPLHNWDRETKAVQAESNTGGWTRHDLRRTGATMLGDLGELPDIVEAALNHTSIRSTLAATYNRSRYRPQVAAALQKLADKLEGIEMAVVDGSQGELRKLNSVVSDRTDGGPNL